MLARILLVISWLQHLHNVLSLVLNVADQVEEAVEHALKVGYRHIDCADAYGNHDECGKAFAKVFSDPKGPKREDVWITTKLNNPDHEPSKVCCVTTPTSSSRQANIPINSLSFQ